MPSTLALTPRPAVAFRLQTASRCASSRWKSRSATPIESATVASPPALDPFVSIVKVSGVLMSSRITGFEASALPIPSAVPGSNVFAPPLPPASTSRKPSLPVSATVPLTASVSTDSSGCALSTLT